MAVLDEDGTIIAVNQAWRDFAAAAGYPGADHGVGTNYLAICERSAGEEPAAFRTVRGLRDVMAGRRRTFRTEYPCSTPTARAGSSFAPARPGGRSRAGSSSRTRTSPT